MTELPSRTAHAVTAGIVLGTVVILETRTMIVPALVRTGILNVTVVATSTKMMTYEADLVQREAPLRLSSK